MSTSGTSDFEMTRDTIVRRSLRMVGAYTSTDSPRPEQMQDAIFILNTMLKAWSVNGLMWLRQFYRVSLVKGQNVYPLGKATPIPMNRPCHVYSANRRTLTNGIPGAEVPIESLTRTDWMLVPNKASTGVPVQYYYDTATLTGQLYVWPTPDSSTQYDLLIDIDTQLDIMKDNLDDFDFPPNWIETITYSLAARLAPEYGTPLAERNKLEEEAGAMFMAMSTDDRDIASIRFQVARR